MEDKTETAPLEGIRVIEFAQAVAGPFAGRILADLGADVIKVEPPSGDLVRDLAVVKHDGFSAMFNHANAAKRSMSLDLKTAIGKVLALSLCRGADVVLENSTPGAMERAGLDFSTVSKINPGVVYASVSSYGQTGSHSRFVGADPVGQAMSGMVYMTGEPEGTPYFATTGIADTSTASHAAIGILAALLRRERTNEGCHLDISMCDVMLFMDCCNAPVAAALGGSSGLRPNGAHNMTVSPFGIFACSNGHVLIEAWGQGEDSLWGRLCTVMGRRELITDEDFATNSSRVRHRDEVTAVIEQWLQPLQKDEAMEALYKARVVAAPVLTPDQAVTHQIYSERETVSEVAIDSSRSVGVINAPYRSTGWQQKRALAPIQGGDTYSVLTEWLGLQLNDIHQLAQSGVFGANQRSELASDGGC